MKLVFLIALCCAAPALAQSPGDVAQRIHLVRAFASAQGAGWGQPPVVRVVWADSSQAPATGRIAGAALLGWMGGAAIGGAVGGAFGYAAGEENTLLGRDGAAVLVGGFFGFVGGALGAPLAASLVGADEPFLAAIYALALPAATFTALYATGIGDGVSAGVTLLALPISAVAATVFADRAAR